MENAIIIAIIAVVLGSAGYYVYKAKKNGKKCIGCPDGCSCSTQKSKCNCGCGSSKTE